MRLWVFLLAMYVLVLSGVPCDALCLEEALPITAGQEAPAHADEQDCKICSPVSMCAACTGFTLPAAVGAAPVASIVPGAAPAWRPRYREPATVEVAACIWQPPQFG